MISSDLYDFCLLLLLERQVCVLAVWFACMPKGSAGLINGTPWSF